MPDEPSPDEPVDPAAPPRRPRQPGDGWVDCACGQRHWGTHGAAGLLLVRRDAAGRATHVLLQHRALWSHHGGTWGIPGGARLPEETAEQGALREAAEEAGVDAGATRVTGALELAHPDWSYTTVVADEVGDVAAAATDPESLEIRWVGVDEVTHRELLPAFADAWPDLRDHLDEPGAATTE